MEYDAYGREVYASGTDRGSYRFAGAKGYQNDDATGMQLLGERYYLPTLGRFLTQDPSGQEGGLNLYGYCAASSFRLLSSRSSVLPARTTRVKAPGKG